MAYSVAQRAALSTLLFGLTLGFWAPPLPAAPRNVLMIAIDDLRPELGCYGAKHIHSPNIDRLASQGVLFERAYCQQAVCNPSRSSLMTGRRPDSIGVTSNHVHFRDKNPGVVTLPEYFKQHGYFTQAVGKIYHGVFPDGASKTTWDTMGDPPSWSAPAIRFGPRYYFTEEGVHQAQRAYLDSYRPRNPQPNDWMKKLVFGPMTEAPDVEDSQHYDGKVTKAAIGQLRQLAKRPDQPFFLAVGFIKPHTPFVAPKKYWDLYDPLKIELAKNTELPRNAPLFAGHGSHEVRRYTDQPKRGEFTPENQTRLKHAYYACISFIDAQVGLVLNELDRLKLRENTVVVLFGDHGWHLGEHGLWGKTTNFELDTRAPLIIRNPGVRDGHKTQSLTEFIDIFPTLVDIAGLPELPVLDGKTLRPVLERKTAALKQAAFSQYPRGKSMGYSMRTNRWRFTEWIDRETYRAIATELYDHQNDASETQNLAAEDENAQLISTLSASLRSSLQIAAPTTPHENAVTNATGFESGRAGPLRRYRDASGIWEAAAGNASIHDQHQRTGKHSLRLLGGAKRQVVWTPRAVEQPADRLEFWFERWTRRQPFDFRIEERVNGKWLTLHHDQQKAIVGSFKNKLELNLNSKAPEQIRFTTTTPNGSGVMIDDLRLVTASPMKVEAITSHTPTLPVLAGNAINPVCELTINISGRLKPIALESISVELLAPTRLNDIAHVELVVADSIPPRDADRLASNPSLRFGQPEAAGTRIEFKGRKVLQPGPNRVYVSLRLANGADVDGRVLARITNAVIGGKSFKVETPPTPPLRMGVALRKSRDDGAHTFRIPGLATTPKGTLISVYDVRRRGGGDLPGDIDVGMSRSTDGGRTWDPMRIIMDMGDDPKWRNDGIGDPAVLVDRNTGTIWVASTWSHGNRSWFGSGPGITPEQTGQLMLVKSDDEGRTWSKPINITRQVKRPEWCFLLQGPGKGITMRDGTLVFAAQYQDTPENKRLPRSTIIYSRDHGKSWSTGAGAFDDTTEAQVVEIRPGVLMLNCRFNRESARVVMTTSDMGKTWQPHSTHRRALIEPRACMASLIHPASESGQGDGRLLLFSNPDSKSARERIMIKASRNRGDHWQARDRLLLDEGRGAGYSCMSMIDEETIGILYEGSTAHLIFQRVLLSDVLGPANKQDDQAADANERDSNQLSLPQCFGSHMVLQADQPIRVWGNALPNTPVQVTLASETASAVSNDAGVWQLTLPPRAPSFAPIRMTVSTPGKTIQFEDILVGQVWLCAGQSNMEWPLRQSTNGADELATAATHPHLRLLHLQGGARGSSGSFDQTHLKRLQPGAFSQGEWSRATEQNAKDFSAVGWYFGRALQESLDQPIGLISPAVGGTPTEAWIDLATLRSNPRFSAMAKGYWLDNKRLGDFCKLRGEQNLAGAIQRGETIPGDALGPSHSFKPGFMWSEGVAPLLPLRIQGVIWYQGESNAESLERAAEHEALFAAMIADWRKQWKRPRMPFGFVQLPAIERPQWPVFREGQRRVATQLPDVGMAVTIDTGQPTNVHPPGKRVVGRRLADWALRDVYRLANAVGPGPRFTNATIRGKQVTVNFAASTLKTIDEQPPRHFELAGEDRKFHPADARIDGDSVVLTSAYVSAPTLVRYAWSPFPRPALNLVDDAGLPAEPFTTLVDYASSIPRAQSGAKRP